MITDKTTRPEAYGPPNPYPPRMVLGGELAVGASFRIDVSGGPWRAREIDLVIEHIKLLRKALTT